MATDLKVEPEITVEDECVILRGVPYQVYVELRDNPENDRLWMTYLDGTLHLMSPEIRHEQSIHCLGRLIQSVTSGLGLEILGIGSTALRKGKSKRSRPIKPSGKSKPTKRNQGSGKEPDTAFYLGEHEARMRGQLTLDLNVDPPPDLAIEVDNTADSAIALPVYARLGVPEVWRFDAVESTVWFGRLEGDAYVSIDRSLCLPVLTTALVLEALDHRTANNLGENAWARWIEGWARGLPNPTA